MHDSADQHATPSGKPAAYSSSLNWIIGVAGLLVTLAGAAIYPMGIEREVEASVGAGRELHLPMPPDLAARLEPGREVRVSCKEWPGGDNEYWPAQVESLDAHSAVLSLRADWLSLPEGSRWSVTVVYGQEAVWRWLLGESTPLGTPSPGREGA